MNNYSFALDRSCVLIHSAHYSKNWNKDKQDEYNAKYYQEHKDKWGVSGGYSESDKEVKYTGQIGDYGADDLDKLQKEHGELGDDHWLGDGGDVSLTTTKDGTKVLMNGDSIVASGKDLDGVDTKVLSKYLTDIYAQAGDHAAEKGLKTGTKEHAAFWKEFDAKVNDQLKGFIAKQKQAQHDDFGDFSDMSAYLSHHGILGMSWGKKNGPPYPLSPSVSASVKRSAGKGGLFSHKKKAATNHVEAAKPQQEQHQETPEEHKAKREAAVRSGDPNQIRKYRDELSNDELQKAITRVGLNRQLNAIDAPKSAFDKVDSAMNKVNKVVGWVGTGIKVWNTAATVHNSLSDGKKWKKIDGGSDKKKDDGKGPTPQSDDSDKKKKK